MKRLIPLVLALAASTVLHAQSGGMKGMDMKDMSLNWPSVQQGQQFVITSIK